jgi:hypothetical protein
MKRSIFLAAFGLTTGLASTYGQGFVFFSSYIANGGAGATTRIFENGQLVGPGFQAQLYYAFGTVSDPVNFSSYTSIVSPVSSAFTLLSGVSAAYGPTGSSGLGYFDGPTVMIPGYTGGPITFEVFGSSYSGDAVGRSGSFTMDSIGGPGAPSNAFGDNGQPMPNFFIAIGPEPTTLAVAGLGGLVSLIMFRRKQS